MADQIKIELPEGMTAEDLQKALKSLAKKPKLTDQEPITFSVIPRDKGELRVARDIYKGRELLNIRSWYLDDNNQLQPGKGVTFNYEELEDIISGLQRMKEWCEENPNGK